MKLFVVALCIAVCSGAKLDNTYLPPGHAKTSGGSGGFLSAPKPFGSGGAPAPGASGPQIPILKYESDNDGDGTYHYEYETGNSIQAQEAGQLKNPGSENEAIDVHGSFTYVGDDGNQYTITYTADENGFQPQGAHLPTPPPIPDAILKSLEQNAAEESRNPQTTNLQGPSSGSRPFGAPKKPSFSAGSGYHY